MCSVWWTLGTLFFGIVVGLALSRIIEGAAEEEAG